MEALSAAGLRSPAVTSTWSKSRSAGFFQVSVTLWPETLAFSCETAAGAFVSATFPLGAALTVAGCERLSASSSANRPNVYVAPLVSPVAVQAVDPATIAAHTRVPSVSLAGA